MQDRYQSQPIHCRHSGKTAFLNERANQVSVIYYLDKQDLVRENELMTDYFSQTGYYERKAILDFRWLHSVKQIDARAEIELKKQSDARKIIYKYSPKFYKHRDARLDLYISELESAKYHCALFFMMSSKIRYANNALNDYLKQQNIVFDYRHYEKSNSVINPKEIENDAWRMWTRYSLFRDDAHSSASFDEYLNNAYSDYQDAKLKHFEDIYSAELARQYHIKMRAYVIAKLADSIKNRYGVFDIVQAIQFTVPADNRVCSIKMFRVTYGNALYEYDISIENIVLGDTILLKTQNNWSSEGKTVVKISKETIVIQDDKEIQKSMKKADLIGCLYMKNGKYGMIV